MHYWLEMVYFVTGGPVLAIIAGFGLRQLILAKYSLDAAREANEVAKKDAAQRNRLRKDQSVGRPLSPVRGEGSTAAMARCYVAITVYPVITSLLCAAKAPKTSLFCRSGTLK